MICWLRWMKCECKPDLEQWKYLLYCAVSVESDENQPFCPRIILGEARIQVLLGSDLLQLFICIYKISCEI